MGLYDNVRCRYPLPEREAQDIVFQTKSTLAPFMEDYVITEDGRLLREVCDERWEEDPKAPLGWVMHGENPRWEPVSFRGHLEIHGVLADPRHGEIWCSYLFWFRDGRVAEVQHGPGHGELLPDRPITVSDLSNDQRQQSASCDAPDRSDARSQHERLWQLVTKLPTDFEPYGSRSRDDDWGPDCSCGCKYFLPLRGALAADWGVCANLQSPRSSLLTFEHMGCRLFAKG